MEVCCQGGRLPGVRGMDHVVDLDGANVVASQAVGGTRMEEAHVGVTFVERPELPSLFPMCRTLVDEQRETSLTEAT